MKPMSGDELKEWRKRLGYTQQQAAERLGVSRVTEQNWESGSTPIPISMRAHCDELARRWKQRPDYGPVALVYCDGPMAQPLWGTARVPMMSNEPYPTNEDALRRACELRSSDEFMNPFISDGEGIVYNGPELMRECERRLAAGRRAPR